MDNDDGDFSLTKGCGFLMTPTLHQQDDILLAELDLAVLVVLVL
jgi:hypothetical protein